MRDFETILSEIYLYQGNKVDNEAANFLIDVIYKEKQLHPINTDLILKKAADNKIINRDEMKKYFESKYK